MSSTKPKPAIKLSVMQGYSRWAKTYDSTSNTLIATEQLYSLNLLGVADGFREIHVLPVRWTPERSGPLSPQGPVFDSSVRLTSRTFCY